MSWTSPEHAWHQSPIFPLSSKRSPCSVLSQTDSQGTCAPANPTEHANTTPLAATPQQPDVCPHLVLRNNPRFPVPLHPRRRFYSRHTHYLHVYIETPSGPESTVDQHAAPVTTKPPRSKINRTTPFFTRAYHVLVRQGAPMARDLLHPRCTP